MTPETRRTTHFFWNYLHNFDLDDPNIALSLLQQPAREGSWRTRRSSRRSRSCSTPSPTTSLLAIAADAALTYFRWALKRRIDAERSAARAA